MRARCFASLAAALACAGFAAAPAWAQDAKAVVDAAKARCEIGETVSGYLEVVEGRADAAVRRAMNEINVRRRAAYQQLARDQGVTPEVVARLTGEKQIARAGGGECVRETAGGAWRRL